MAEQLALLAASGDDLPPLSALLQDATLRLADIAYDRRARRLVCLVNRYRREAPGQSRIRCVLRLETVAAVQRHSWPSDPEAVVNILSLAQDGDWLVLTFGGGAALRARAEVVDVLLEDVGEAWNTARVPQHD
ncbi:DUF2948 family protein [Sandarakinorhabdus sp.]|uniref:DUF2948 family protein n=1 Tax=Sandarakinorhabdus sp. TaxID=1916663 RepID=UPI00286E6632|nr:DUF2948 family protein [Sandarakinorhabdus sp.]